MTIPKSRAACLAALLLGAWSTAWGAPRTLTADLGPQDDACNYEPLVFEVEAGELVILAVTGPSGFVIRGWDCARDLCTRELQIREPYEEVLVVDNGDPERLGGAVLYIDPAPGCPQCALSAPSPCCACPCDFAPDCD
jgi:hypothetical protein